MMIKFGRALTAHCSLPYLLTLGGLLLVGFGGCGRQPYDGRIASDSQQPDKLLFDKAVDDLERRRYQQARLAFQTLINTYPDSEYLSEAERAIEESWKREGTISPARQN